MIDWTDIILAVIVTIPTVIGLLVRKEQKDAKVKMQEIHVLVNSRLTDALREIRSLKQSAGIPTTEEEDDK